MLNRNYSLHEALSINKSIRNKNCMTFNYSIVRTFPIDVQIRPNFLEDECASMYADFSDLECFEQFSILTGPYLNHFLGNELLGALGENYRGNNLVLRLVKNNIRIDHVDISS